MSAQKHQSGLIIVSLGLLIVAFVFLVCWATTDHKSSIVTATPLPTASNLVSFPTQSDTLTAGQTYTLKWNDTKDSGPINIFLVNKAAEAQGVSVSLFDRVYNISNSGSYSYKVPANLPSGEYKFEIGQLNSDYFNIK